jgi:O-antigen ligase
MRLWLLLLIVTTSIALFMTFTRSAWLIAAIGAILLVARVNRRWFLPVGLVLAAVPLFLPQVAARFADLANRRTALSGNDAANSLLWRFDYWDQILDLSGQNRLTGVGLDNVQLMTTLGLKPHNIFVQAYVELGWLGCAVLAVAVMMVAGQIRRRIAMADSHEQRSSAAIAAVVGLCMLAQAMTTNPLTSTMLWWYFAAALSYGAYTPTRQVFVDKLRARRASRMASAMGARVDRYRHAMTVS